MSTRALRLLLIFVRSDSATGDFGLDGSDRESTMVRSPMASLINSTVARRISTGISFDVSADFIVIVLMLIVLPSRSSCAHLAPSAEGQQ